MIVIKSINARYAIDALLRVYVVMWSYLLRESGNWVMLSIVQRNNKKMNDIDV